MSGARRPSGVARALGRVDAVVGDAVERAVRVHHRRRLRRVGWACRALDAPARRSAPRTRFRRARATRSRCCRRGRRAAAHREPRYARPTHSVDLAGWFFCARLRARASDLSGAPSRRLLGAIAGRRVEVRVLAWAGAPLPLFRPSRRQVARRDAPRCRDVARASPSLPTLASGRCTATTRSS